MRRALVVVVVLAVLTVAADVGARLFAERLVSERLAASLGLRRDPGVSLSGVPFVPHLVGGGVPSATIDADQVDAGPVTLDSVHATLYDVRFSFWKLVGGGEATITADSGEGQAVLTEEAANRAIRALGDVTVSFQDDRVLVNAPALDATLDASLSVSGDRLLLRSSGLPELTVRLPTPLPNLRFTGVRIEAGRAVLSFRLGSWVVRGSG